MESIKPHHLDAQTAESVHPMAAVLLCASAIRTYGPNEFVRWRRTSGQLDWLFFLPIWGSVKILVSATYNVAFEFEVADPLFKFELAGTTEDDAADVEQSWVWKRLPPSY